MSEPKSEWRDIATAPRDSLAVLVWCPRCKCAFTAIWWVDHWEHFGGSARALDEEPSHWMPIPGEPE